MVPSEPQPRPSEIRVWNISFKKINTYEFLIRLIHFLTLNDMKFSEVLPMADQQPPLEKKRITPLLL